MATSAAKMPEHLQAYERNVLLINVLAAMTGGQFHVSIIAALLSAKLGSGTSSWQLGELWCLTDQLLETSFWW
jgi:hypothetical protein